MRIEELFVPGPGEPADLRFDQPVTVVGPASPDRRRALAQALMGGPTKRSGSVLYVRDCTGRPALIDSDGANYLDDGTAAPGLRTVLPPGLVAHRAHMCVGPAALGLPIEALSQRHRAELEAARTARGQLERQAARGRTPDSGALERRLTAMTARVNALEERYGQASIIPPVAEIRDRLLARLTALTHLDDTDESLPVIFDDPLVSVPVDRRCDLLDMLLRTSKRVQVIYLTQDTVVLRWARAQAPVLGISVLSLSSNPT